MPSDLVKPRNKFDGRSKRPHEFTSDEARAHRAALLSSVHSMTQVDGTSLPAGTVLFKNQNSNLMKPCWAPHRAVGAFPPCAQQKSTFKNEGRGSSEYKITDAPQPSTSMHDDHKRMFAKQEHIDPLINVAIPVQVVSPVRETEDKPSAKKPAIMGSRWAPGGDAICNNISFLTSTFQLKSSHPLRASAAVFESSSPFKSPQESRRLVTPPVYRQSPQTVNLGLPQDQDSGVRRFEASQIPHLQLNQTISPSPAHLQVNKSEPTSQIGHQDISSLSELGFHLRTSKPTQAEVHYFSRSQLQVSLFSQEHPWSQDNRGLLATQSNLVSGCSLPPPPSILPQSISVNSANDMLSLPRTTAAQRGGAVPRSHTSHHMKQSHVGQLDNTPVQKTWEHSRYHWEGPSSIPTKRATYSPRDTTNTHLLLTGATSASTTSAVNTAVPIATSSPGGSLAVAKGALSARSSSHLLNQVATNQVDQNTRRAEQRSDLLNSNSHGGVALSTISTTAPANFQMLPSTTKIPAPVSNLVSENVVTLEDIVNGNNTLKQIMPHEKEPEIQDPWGTHLLKWAKQEALCTSPAAASTANTHLPPTHISTQCSNTAAVSATVIARNSGHEIAPLFKVPQEMVPVVHDSWGVYSLKWAQQEALRTSPAATLPINTHVPSTNISVSAPINPPKNMAGLGEDHGHEKCFQRMLPNEMAPEALDAWAAYAQNWAQRETVHTLPTNSTHTEAMDSLSVTVHQNNESYAINAAPQLSYLSANLVSLPPGSDDVQPSHGARQSHEHTVVSLSVAVKSCGSFDPNNYGNPQKILPSKTMERMNAQESSPEIEEGFKQLRPPGMVHGSKVDPSLLDTDAFLKQMEAERRTKNPRGEFYTRTTAAPAPVKSNDEMSCELEEVQVWTNTPAGKGTAAALDQFPWRCSTQANHTSYSPSKLNTGTPLVVPNTNKRFAPTKQSAWPHDTISENKIIESKLTAASHNTTKTATPQANEPDHAILPPHLAIKKVGAVPKALPAKLEDIQTATLRPFTGNSDPITLEILQDALKNDKSQALELFRADLLSKDTVVSSGVPLTTQILAQTTGQAPRNRSEAVSFDEKISDAGIPKENVRAKQGQDGAEQLLDFDGKTWLPAPVDWEGRRSFDDKYVPAYIREWSKHVSIPSKPIDTTVPEFIEGTHFATEERLEPPPQHIPTLAPSSFKDDAVRVARTSKDAIKSAKLKFNSQVEDDRSVAQAQTQRRKDLAMTQPEPDPFSPSINMYLRAATTKDASGIAAIYNYYVKNSIIPEDQKDVTDQDIKWYIDGCKKNKLPFIVAVKGDFPPKTDAQGRKSNSTPILPQFEAIIGFALAEIYNLGISALCTGRSRCNAMLQLYVQPEYKSKGVGRNLFDRLLHSMSHSYGHRDAAKWVQPSSHATNIYESSQNDRWHQLFFHLPVTTQEDPEFLRTRDFLAKFYFYGEHTLKSAVRTSTEQPTAKFADLVIFQGTALPADIFGPSV